MSSTHVIVPYPSHNGGHLSLPWSSYWSTLRGRLEREKNIRSPLQPIRRDFPAN